MKKIRTGLVLLLLLTLSVSLFTAPVSAQGVGPDFICSGDNTLEEDLGGVISLFVFGTPAAGAIIYFFTKGGKVFGIDKNGLGKDALIAGFVAPLSIYFFEWVLDIAFGINFSCLLPGGG